MITNYIYWWSLSQLIISKIVIANINTKLCCAHIMFCWTYMPYCHCHVLGLHMWIFHNVIALSDMLWPPHFYIFHHCTWVTAEYDTRLIFGADLSMWTFRLVDMMWLQCEFHSGCKVRNCPTKCGTIMVCGHLFCINPDNNSIVESIILLIGSLKPVWKPKVFQICNHTFHSQGIDWSLRERFPWQECLACW